MKLTLVFLLVCPQLTVLRPDYYLTTTALPRPSLTDRRTGHSTTTTKKPVEYTHSTVCQSDGEWSQAPQPDLFDCRDVVCAQFSTPANCEAQGTDYTYQSVVNFVCKQGFKKASGDASRECQADGTWTGTAPVCVASNEPTQMCGSVRVRKEFKQYLFTGAMPDFPSAADNYATLQCKDNYKLEGATEVAGVVGLKFKCVGRATGNSADWTYDTGGVYPAALDGKIVTRAAWPKCVMRTCRYPAKVRNANTRSKGHLSWLIKQAIKRKQIPAGHAPVGSSLSYSCYR